MNMPILTQTIQVADKQTSLIQYKSVPVMTTEQMAEFYGTDQVRIRQNYDRNNKRFSEGKHFFKIEGDDLRELKNSLSSLKILSPNTRSLTLWTEKGAARHAKILDTDQAWEVFEQLEDCYFAVKELTQSNPPKVKPIQLGSVTRQCAMMAKALGFKGNQHTLATDKAVKALTGQSPLELMGETHLIAENKQQVFTPTQLGEMVEPKISARKVNTVLEQLGYQEKANGVWIITPKGEKLCEMLDTGKKHGDGTPVKQVKWYQSVMDDIKRELKDICEGAKQ